MKYKKIKTKAKKQKQIKQQRIKPMKKPNKMKMKLKMKLKIKQNQHLKKPQIKPMKLILLNKKINLKKESIKDINTKPLIKQYLIILLKLNFYQRNEIQNYTEKITVDQYYPDPQPL